MRAWMILVLVCLFTQMAGAAAIVTVAPDLPTGERAHYYTAPVDYPTELILFGTYEPSQSNSAGVISVDVGAGTAPLVLVLSSYETGLVGPSHRTWSFGPTDHPEWFQDTADRGGRRHPRHESEPRQ